MKIQVFGAISQGISLSFKNRRILDLITMYSFFWIFFTVLVINPLILQIRLDETAYPAVSPIVGFNEILTIFVFFLLSTFFLYIIAKIIFENLNKREISILSAKISVLKKIIPILIATIIYFVVVVIGFVFLIIPGIFLSIALFFYSYAILLNNKGIIASFKESYSIVKGNWWQIFALYLIFIIIFVLGGFLSGIFLILLPVVSIIIDFMLYFATGVMMVIYTIIYFQLIKKEEKTKEEIGGVEVESAEIVH